MAGAERQDRMAVELSRGYRDDPRRWPFGAIVVIGGQIVGTGINQVAELNDPTGHAEVMALRMAGGVLGQGHGTQPDFLVLTLITGALDAGRPTALSDRGER